MKTGRNDPCPCGSGKKFKKCCMDRVEDGVLFPSEHRKSLAHQMRLGYDLYWKRDYAGACDKWLDIWRAISDAAKEKGLLDIAYIDDEFADIETATNWCYDLYGALRIASFNGPYGVQLAGFAREFVEVLPGSGLSIIQNMRVSEAEAYAAMGDIDTAEALFDAVVCDYPKWEPGYIAWADIFCDEYYGCPADREKARTILRTGLATGVEGPGELIKKLMVIDDDDASDAAIEVLVRSGHDYDDAAWAVEDARWLQRDETRDDEKISVDRLVEDALKMLAKG